MITLKKSFELKNYLEQLLAQAMYALNTSNVTTATQIHYKSKAYSEANDETVVVPKRDEYPFTMVALIDFVCAIQSEMATLTLAINNAKHQDGKDFDGAISNNKTKRDVLRKMEELAAIKPSERKLTGTAMKFNENGEQVPYKYDVTEVTTIDFDRNEVKGIIKRLRKEIDEASAAIDEMQLNLKVDFESQFEIGDSLEDAVATFCKTLTKASA